MTTTALVTGASGMLGANLCLRLAERGLRVRAYVRQPLRHPLLEGVPVEQAFGDLADAAALRAALRGCDYLFHTAGLISYHDADTPRLEETNVRGTQNALRAAAEAGVRRVIYTSSTAAVGIPRPDQPPLTEDDAFDPRYRRNPYMETKRRAEEIALGPSPVEVVAVNPTTIYGAGDVKLNTGVLFQKIKAGRLFAAPPGGSSVVSVRDCVEGHLLALEKGVPGRRYILASHDLSYFELFSRIARHVGGRPPRFRLPRFLEPWAYAGAAGSGYLGLARASRHLVRIGFRDRFFSAERARRELSWQPRQSVDEMLAEAAAFYARHGLLR